MQLLILIAIVIIVRIASRHACGELLHEEGKGSMQQETKEKNQ
jgi:hypothetical protein